ncbi:MAG: nitroreductase [Myxococcales bacterium]|nr:MAG: nitroreductase [Myxococcales bacterium]
MTKRGNADHEIHDLIAERWSPYAFSGEHVSGEDLSAIFEAARWAPSSYNEQPWRYIVAAKADAEGFEKLLSCLVAGNQAWARSAAVLALGVVSYRFARNDKPNAAAEHDLGLASANLCIEATARGLYVHQMIGILPDCARELYAIPEGSSALTGLAIGHLGDAAALPDNLRERDGALRARKPLSEFVFAGSWSSPAKL